MHREVDTPVVSSSIGAAASSSESAPNPASPSRTTAWQRQPPGPVTMGSSAAEHALPPSLDGSTSPHADPSEGGTASTLGSGAVAPGSSAAGGSTASPASPIPQRPVTQLQQGITKPKQYSDGTVWWCMSSMTSTDESPSVDEAFGNKNWEEAMDAEYQALHRNKT